MTKAFYSRPALWAQVGSIPAESFECAYCGDSVSSVAGWLLQSQETSNLGHKATIRICPGCLGPNVFGPERRYPGVSFGESVPSLPNELERLYEEARASASTGAYTGAVLICRKMLMNIAVAQGAAEGERFVEYVEHLSNKGFIPPNGKAWVDYIRTRGNEATHEIALMTEGDAKALIVFVEMLLRFIYEFPQMVPSATP